MDFDSFCEQLHQHRIKRRNRQDMFPLRLFGQNKSGCAILSYFLLFRWVKHGMQSLYRSGIGRACDFEINVVQNAMKAFDRGITMNIHINSIFRGAIWTYIL